MNDKRTTVSDEIDALAQEIRRVDGENSLGAGALAEALQPFLTELQHRREAKATWHALDEEGYAELRVCGKRITTFASWPAAEEAADRINSALAASPSSPACGVRVKATEADVERVARALAADELGMGDPPAVVESIVNHQWRAFESQARVALSALGEHP